jgi:phenylalanyl-tRNA synthetase beta chain
MKGKVRKVVEMVVVEYCCAEMEKLSGMGRKKIIDGLTMIGAPTEEADGGRLLTELTPNRPDWFSMEGLARALRTYYGGNEPIYTVKKSNYKVIVDSTVRRIRPYTVCVVIKDLKFNEQRIKDMVLLQEKLNATLGRKVKKFGMGIYPLEKIRFPVKYTTMKPEEIRYVPLGYTKEANAKEIIENHPKGKEHGHLINGLDRYPVFLDANGRIMCLIPIVNSAETGQITESTKEIFIEVTGMDMNAVVAALNILSCAFADMGGTIYGVEMNYPGKKVITPDLRPKKRKIDMWNVNKLLGVKLSEKELGSMLKRMGHKYVGGYVYVPPYRADIIHEVDIIEDVAIVYGYNRFEPTLPNFFNEGKSIPMHPAHRVMPGMGFLEITTTVLSNKKQVGISGYAGPLLEIRNPIGEEYTLVRPELLVDMLLVLQQNKMKGLPQRFYELGSVYENGKDRKKLVFAIRDKDVEFADVRGYLQTLLVQLDKEFTLKKSTHRLFEEEMSMDVSIAGNSVGVLGKVKQTVLESFGLEQNVYLCEIGI